MTKQIATVAFHGTPLTVITHDSQQLVAMKPIVEAIGLQWEAQYKRIQRHPVLKPAMSIMDIPSAGGNQRTACLPIASCWPSFRKITSTDTARSKHSRLFSEIKRPTSMESQKAKEQSHASAKS